MRNKRYFSIQTAAVAFTLLLLSFLPACSDENGGNSPDIPDGKLYTLTINLRSKENALPTYTKADPNHDNFERHILNWWLIIKGNGTDNKDFYKYMTDDPQSDNPADFSETSVKAELPAGQYKIYALANLRSLTNAQEVIEAIEAGTLPTDKGVSLPPMTRFDEQSNYIPMTSYGYEVEVSENTPELAIPLIRLIGKVTLTVTNYQSSPITLNGLSLDGLRADEQPIFLFPYDIDEAGNLRNLLQADVQESYKPKFPEDAWGQTMSKVFVTEGEAVEIANEGAVTYTSYVNETASQGNSDLTITTKIDGRNDQPQSFDIDFIRRNDWLQIPVNVTDADIVIEFDQQHMPIGGLPRSIHFPSGPIVPQGAYETDHAGDITITYRLTNVSSFTSPVFKHYKDNFVGSEIYSSAVLLTNGEESEHTNLLINTPKDNTYAPWLDKSKKAFKLPEENAAEGSFKVTAQELSIAAEATIQLTLVIVEQDPQTNGNREIALPYTITLKNKEGGNS